MVDRDATMIVIRQSPRSARQEKTTKMMEEDEKAREDDNKRMEKAGDGGKSLRKDE